MKFFVSVVVVVAGMTFNSIAFALGNYKIQVTKHNENVYSVELISSYSERYNQPLPGIYASIKKAEQAGHSALETLLVSEAKHNSNPCSHVLISCRKK